MNASATKSPIEFTNAKGAPRKIHEVDITIDLSWAKDGIDGEFVGDLIVEETTSDFYAVAGVLANGKGEGETVQVLFADERAELLRQGDLVSDARQWYAEESQEGDPSRQFNYGITVQGAWIPRVDANGNKRFDLLAARWITSVNEKPITEGSLPEIN